MKAVAKFEKVSFDQFKQSWLKINPTSKTEWTDDEILDMYTKITLPRRKTPGSAGYDFVSPFEFSLDVGKSILIPTGIRCKIDDGYVLKVYPRSGHGTKYYCVFANTVGIIDSDYYTADNEGHIFVKLVFNGLKDSPVGSDGKPLMTVKQGESFVQGLFSDYFITYDDDEDEKSVRVGGMGSTDQK